MSKNWRQPAWEIFKFVAIVLLIVVPIRAFVAQPFIVSGDSMDPTFTDHEYLIVDELSYHLRPPARGEVVVFKYPNNPKVYYIKRIVGLPGETVTLRDKQVFVRQGNGPEQLIDWPDLNNNNAIPAPNGQTEFTLGPSQYFVLGDNRSVSSDSRYWGALPANLITGRALVSLFPLNRIAFQPGKV